MSINLTQSFLYETDSLDSFKKVLEAIVKVMYDEKPSKYAQMFVTRMADRFNDGKKWIGPKEINSSNPAGWSKPNFLHVCTIGNYKEDAREGDERPCNYAGLVNVVMRHLKNADVEKFYTQCGDGYDSSFNRFDGSISAGYRINSRPLGGANYLDISLCHIYYGK